jgi:hypothetical protein
MRLAGSGKRRHSHDHDQRSDPQQLRVTSHEGTRRPARTKRIAAAMTSKSIFETRRSIL